MKEFNAINYMVKKSRSVKKELGILAVCDKCRGKQLSAHLKEEVRTFYEQDDNSRMCPGKEEVIMVRDKDDVKIAHQERLVLSNLRELYTKWKDEHNQTIKFSSFASLKPTWCVLAGATRHPQRMCVPISPKCKTDGYLFGLISH